MTNKIALIDENDDVQNVIVAGEGYQNLKYTTIIADGHGVQPGDYYDSETDEFVTPQLTLDTPDTIPNDGSEETIEITTTARDEQDATLAIDDFSEEITVSTDEPTTETITTTASEGTTIEVSVAPESDIRGDTAEIEVVST